MASHPVAARQDATVRDLVVIGASAGGVETLQQLVAGLSPDLPAAVLIVQHLLPVGSTVLPNILSRATSLPCSMAHEGDALVAGRILIAPADRHLVVCEDHVTLSAGPRENSSRPAVDVLFRSAARSYGPRVIAVVLSGALDDGTAGMVAVRACGGVGIVQDPASAIQPSMPRCALEGAGADYVLPVAAIPAMLAELTTAELDVEWTGPSDLVSAEVELAQVSAGTAHRLEGARIGEPSGLTCPECGASLFRIEDGGPTRFRCGLGHAWSPETLVAQQRTALESALWMALRTLEERAALTGELSQRALAAGRGLSGQSFEEQSREAIRAAALVRELLLRAASGGVDLAPRRL